MSLASSSTLCRFEQHAERQWAIAIHQELVEQFIASFARRPKELVLDFDATDDPVHSHQSGRFFHGYYDYPPPLDWSTLGLWNEEDQRWPGSATSRRRS